jgi:hypothetical protein
VCADVVTVPVPVSSVACEVLAADVGLTLKAERGRSGGRNHKAALDPVVSVWFPE